MKKLVSFGLVVWLVIGLLGFAHAEEESSVIFTIKSDKEICLIGNDVNINCAIKNTSQKNIYIYFREIPLPYSSLKIKGPDGVDCSSVPLMIYKLRGPIKEDYRFICPKSSFECTFKGVIKYGKLHTGYNGLYIDFKDTAILFPQGFGKYEICVEFKGWDGYETNKEGEEIHYSKKFNLENVYTQTAISNKITIDVIQQATIQNPIGFLPATTLDHLRTPKQLYLKASDCFNKADYVTALEIFTKLVESYPQSSLAPPSQYQIAVIYLDKLKYTEQGTRELKRFLSLYPSDTLVPIIYYKLAKTLYELQNYREALSTVEEALKKVNPHSIYHQNIDYLVPPCLFEVSKTNFNAQNYPAALDGFQRILKEYPKSSYAKDSLLFSGHCYHLLKKRNKAYSVYCKYLAKYGKYGLQSIDYFYIGQNFRILEHKREAFWYLKQAAKKTTKEASLSKEIDIEMRRCLITPFWAHPPASCNAIAATDKDIWILRGSSSSEFLNSLSRFNKAEKKWVVYDYEGGYVSKGLSSMVVDENSVWIGTYEDGLIRYNFVEDAWRYYTVKDGLAGSTVLSLVKDGDILWIGGKSTITKFDINNNTFSKFVVPVDFDGVCSLVASDKYVWAAGRSSKVNSLVRLNKDAKNWWEGWTIIPSTEFNAGNINTFAADGKYLWIGTDDGIRRYDTETQECSSMTKESGIITKNVQSIIVTKDFVWFSTGIEGQPGLGSGLGCYVCYNKAEQTWNARPIGQGVNSLAVDGRSLLMNFIGTNEIKRFNLDTGEWTEGVPAQFISNNYVTDILVGDKYVWVATGNTGKGIDRLNKKNLNWDHFTGKNGLPDGGVFSLVAYDDEILTGVWRYGTFSFDRKNSKFIPFPATKEQRGEELMPLLADGSTIWFQLFNNQVSSGPKGYDIPTGKWFSFSTASGLLDNRIYSMAADNKFVWIGTINGVNRYDKNFHKLEIFLETNKGLNSERKNMIYALQPDGNDLWISVSNKGLFKYDKETKKGKLYLEEKHPSPGTDDATTCRTENIKADKNYLYLATSKGLIIYDKKEDKWFGFNDNEFLGWGLLNNIRIDGDFLWLGSRFWGLARFDKKLWLEYKEILP